MLERIDSVDDLKALDIGELEALSREVREYIIDVISRNGGHLASSLGVVELTVALHYVFNAPADTIIWDVGHQTYAHKIITGRREAFKRVRKLGGISGFPKVNESPFDPFNVGHSSTSLSLALGTAVARDIRNEDFKVIAVIGDGSLTGGMAFEALNNIGHTDTDLIVILNDNEHSISKNVGALSNYLTRIITDPYYNRLRSKTMRLVKRIPKIGGALYNFMYHFFEGFKGLLVPGRLFDDMGLRYFGPVDGHNLSLLVDVMNKVKQINAGPKIIHVITRKGKGYLPAEKNPSLFHGVGPFDRATGIPLKRGTGMSYSSIAGKTVARLAASDESIMAITAAMKLGTGLYEFEDHFPERFFDVGIAEQHAITFAAALASRGLKPFVSVYSTFLQRAVDQLIHDVAIMNLPVRILIDRSGIVGDDGETHHGLFDIAIIRNIPNMIFLAPSGGEELRDMIAFAAGYSGGPVAIRFPRGNTGEKTIDLERFGHYRPGRMRVAARGGDIAILALGDMVATGMKVRELLKGKGVDAAVVNLRSIKPLDMPGIEKMLMESAHFITLENGVVSGGIGEFIAASVRNDLKGRLLFLGGFPDRFITHGTNSELLAHYGLDPRSLCSRILRSIKNKKAVS
ncbi:MAG: 1-deoxy-D-xylulose-5-phosphate synthase [Spirochaetes bacterium]|nr:1-deoxy-D-xylulose-5-phosphate synthase [Spirochaetota bacterium]